MRYSIENEGRWCQFLRGQMVNLRIGVVGHKSRPISQPRPVSKLAAATADSLGNLAWVDVEIGVKVRTVTR